MTSSKNTLTCTQFQNNMAKPIVIIRLHLYHWFCDVRIYDCGCGLLQERKFIVICNKNLNWILVLIFLLHKLAYFRCITGMGWGRGWVTNLFWASWVAPTWRMMNRESSLPFLVCLHVYFKFTAARKGHI